MIFPSVDDTIIAVATGWEPSPLGVVRLSGPESFVLVGKLGGSAPARAASARPRWTESCLELGYGSTIPAQVFWFHGPHSYTGQDVVELHVPGCPPILRELCGQLISLGARRSLPGEFTARAFLSGKLSAAQVEDVLAALRADSDTDVRIASRAGRVSCAELLGHLQEQIARLLARVEAGIDFIEEEDIRFVTAPEAAATIDQVLDVLGQLNQGAPAQPRLARPHVALVGLPNAGKSTLFNALLGYQRAIVAPVLGTTRDVLSAEIDVGGVNIVLQDCAGLGDSADELDCAAHLAAEAVAEQADLVLWVHAVDTPWKLRESAAVAQVPSERLLLVWSKTDLAQTGVEASFPAAFSEAADVCAHTGSGLARLADVICRRVSARRDGFAHSLPNERLWEITRSLERARGLVTGQPGSVRESALLALELRNAYTLVSGSAHGLSAEVVLGLIFSQFCVGK